MDTESTFRTEVKITAAWDSGTREHGQHCAELLFVLHGPKACLSFVIYTGWCLDPKKNFPQMPVNVFYHGLSPTDPDDCFHEDCDVLGGKACYFGRVGCPDLLFKVLTEQGSDGLWQQMEALYRDLFDKEPAWLVEPYEQMAASARRGV